MSLAVLVPVLVRPETSGGQLVSECSLEVEPGRVVQLLVNVPPAQVGRLEITVAQTS